MTDTYSTRYVRFVQVPWHATAFTAAYLDQSSACSHELERLSREFQTLPPRHDCSCRCPNESRGWPPCPECKRLRTSAETTADIALEMGRSSIPDSVVPMVLLLDLRRALAVLGRSGSPSAIARYLSGPERDAA